MRLLPIQYSLRNRSQTLVDTLESLNYNPIMRTLIGCNSLPNPF